MEAGLALDRALESFFEQVSRVVWCTLATVDGRGRPRSRLVHPVWDVVDGKLTGWLLARAETLKVSHVEANPFVSCSYWDPSQHTAVAECRAYRHDTAEAWERTAAAPAPLGYDPASLGVWNSPDDPGCAAIRLEPWFVRVVEVGKAPVVWRES